MHKVRQNLSNQTTEHDHFPLGFGTGIEGSRILGLANPEMDVLKLTGHDEWLFEDLHLMHKLSPHGLHRYCLPSHRTDQSLVERAMSEIKRLELRVAVDPFHHTAINPHFAHGYADPRFVDWAVQYVLDFAERYPWVEWVTPVNEPIATSVLYALAGLWGPFHDDHAAFCRMVVNMARVACELGERLPTINPNVKFLMVDTLENHYAVDDASQEIAAHCNERRFLHDELVLGRMQPTGQTAPMWRYLTQNGIMPQELFWFLDHPVRVPIVRGLDYYPHSDMTWGDNRLQSTTPQPAGLVRIALDYHRQLGVPMTLSEINVRAEREVGVGTLNEVESQKAWLGLVLEQVEILRAHGVALQGVNWYPLLNTFGWSGACLNGLRTFQDPQGLVELVGKDLERHPTELYRTIQRLAAGEIRYQSLFASSFAEPEREYLASYLAHHVARHTAQNN